jgi:lipopolysaccharide transport system permease protein
MTSFVEDIKALIGLKNKFLLYNILSRNLKLKYRKSYLGFFWTILVPGANALVYYYVFNKVMKQQIPNHLLFLISGILPWTFFSLSVMHCMESILQNHNLLNKVPLPPHIFPLSEVLTAFVNFLLSLPVLLVIQFMMIGFYPIGFINLLLLSLLLFIQAYGLGLMLAYGFVFLRDLRHLVGIIMQLWFYITPIVYSRDMIPEKFNFVVYMNPVALIFDQIHSSFVFKQSLSLVELCYSVLWSAGIAVAAYLTYRKFNGTIVESV